MTLCTVEHDQVIGGWGRRLAGMRIAAGWTLETIAAELRVPKEAVAEIEADGDATTPLTAKYADLFGLTLADLARFDAAALDRLIVTHGTSTPLADRESLAARIAAAADDLARVNRDARHAADLVRECLAAMQRDG